MIQTLIPPPASAPARTRGRFGKFFATTLTARTLLLFLAGLLCAIPGFLGLHWLLLMLAWDAVVLLLVLTDILSLPPAHSLRVTRTFIDSPVLGRETRIELAVEHATNSVLQVHLADDLHPALALLPPSGSLTVYPRDSARIVFTVTPNRRGDCTLGPVWLRWQGRLRLVERRAFSDPAQK